VGVAEDVVVYIFTYQSLAMKDWRFIQGEVNLLMGVVLLDFHPIWRCVKLEEAESTPVNAVSRRIVNHLRLVMSFQTEVMGESEDNTP